MRLFAISSSGRHFLEKYCNLEYRLQLCLKYARDFIRENSDIWATSIHQGSNRHNRLDLKISGRMYGSGCSHPTPTTDLRNISDTMEISEIPNQAKYLDKLLTFELYSLFIISLIVSSKHQDLGVQQLQAGLVHTSRPFRFTAKMKNGQVVKKKILLICA